MSLNWENAVRVQNGRKFEICVADSHLTLVIINRIKFFTSKASFLYFRAQVRNSSPSIKIGGLLIGHWLISICRICRGPHGAWRLFWRNGNGGSITWYGSSLDRKCD